MIFQIHHTAYFFHISHEIPSLLTKKKKILYYELLLRYCLHLNETINSTYSMRSYNTFYVASDL